MSRRGAASMYEKAAMGALELARHHYANKEYKEAAALFHKPLLGK